MSRSSHHGEGLSVVLVIGDVVRSSATSRQEPGEGPVVGSAHVVSGGSRRLAFVLIAFVLIALVVGGAWWWRSSDVVGPSTHEEGPMGRRSLSSVPWAGSAPDGERAAARTGSTAAVWGTVHDVRGRPVVEARICAELAAADVGPSGGLPPRCATTGLDGHYRLSPLPAAEVVLHASAPGHRADRYPSLPASSIQTPARLTLAAGRELSHDFVLETGGIRVDGVVRDITGGVIDDAWVSAETSAITRGWVFVRSDEQGRFSLWADGPELTVHARSPGYGQGSRSVTVPGTFVELWLTPESVVAGRVVAVSTGAPLEGLFITIGRRWRAHGPPRACSGPGGGFRLEGLPPGEYKLGVYGDDDLWIGSGSERIHLGLAETRDDVVLTARRGLAVEGAVLYRDGTPCARGSVSLSPTDVVAPAVGGEVGAGGSVRIGPLLPGRYAVEVGCEGAVSHRVAREVLLSDASVRGLRWTVEPGRSIHGTVVDAAGSPAARAKVYLSVERPSEGQSAQGRDFTVRADAAGRFELRGLPPGRHKLMAQAAHADHNRSAFLPVALTAAADVDDLVLVIPTPGDVEVEVVDTQGRPVEGMTVALIQPSVPFTTAVTNAKGEVAFRQMNIEPARVALPEGEVELIFRYMDDDYGRPIELRPSEIVRERLVVDARDGSIDGRVEDASGSPVGDAYIVVSRERGDSPSFSAATLSLDAEAQGQRPVMTEEDGTFRVQRLVSDAQYTVYALRTGGEEAKAQHVRPGQDVTLCLAPTGSLAGRVRFPSGEAPARFSLEVTGKAYRHGEDFVLTDGRWRVSGLPAGALRVTAERERWTTERSVTLGSGESREDLELVLEPRSPP